MSVMSATETPAATRAPAAGAPGAAARPVHDIHECLSFKVGNEEYGIDILRVQEIRSFEPTTRIAGMPHFIRGVLNLRGVIVPVVDLRLKLGCDATFDTATVTVVLNVAGRTIGIVVDSVSDVQRLHKEQLRPAPDISSTLRDGHVVGLASLHNGETERLLILLDIERLMSDSDMGLVDVQG